MGLHGPVPFSLNSGHTHLRGFKLDALDVKPNGQDRKREDKDESAHGFQVNRRCQYTEHGNPQGLAGQKGL